LLFTNKLLKDEKAKALQMLYIGLLALGDDVAKTFLERLEKFLDVVD